MANILELERFSDKKDPTFVSITEEFNYNQKKWVEQNQDFYFNPISHVYPKDSKSLIDMIKKQIKPDLQKLADEDEPDYEKIARINKSLDDLEGVLTRAQLRELNAQKLYKKQLCELWISSLDKVIEKLDNKSQLFPKLKKIDDYSYGITLNYSSVNVVMVHNTDTNPHPFKYSLVNGLTLFSIPIQHQTVESFCESRVKLVKQMKDELEKKRSGNQKTELEPSSSDKKEQKLSTAAFHQNLRAGNIRTVRRGGSNGSWLINCAFDPRSTVNKRQDYSSTLYSLNEVLDKPIEEFLKENNIGSDIRYIRIWQLLPKNSKLEKYRKKYIVELYTDMPIFNKDNANYKEILILDNENRRVFEDYLLSYAGITATFDLPFKTVYL